MTQETYDKICNSISYDADLLKAMKKLWREYLRLNGMMMYSSQPTINVYYDKPDEDKK